MARGVEISFVSGPIRCGKTYLLVGELVDQILPESELIVVTNLPLRMDAVVDYLVKNHGGVRSDWYDRVKFIPESTLKSWRVDDEKGNPKGSPLSEYAGVDLTGHHFIIDEIHNFCGLEHSKKHTQIWGQWLGELGHSQASIEFISQSPAKVHKTIHIHAHKRRELVPSSLRTDPLFRIVLDDWYELRAKVRTWFTPREKRSGCFTPGLMVRSGYMDKTRFVEQSRSLCWVTGKYFGLYDSFAAPIAGGVGASEARQHEFERRSFIGLLL